MMQPAHALNSWRIGADSFPSTQLSEIRTNVNVVTLPNSVADLQTFYWLGGFSNGSTDQYLTQPVLEPQADMQHWGTYFVIYDKTTGSEPVNVFTNVVFSPGGSALLDDSISSNGVNCQTVTDNNNPANSDNQCFGTNYGSYFNELATNLESYDFTGSDFYSMNSNISFTRITDFDLNGNAGTPTMLGGSDYTGSQPPPQGITSSGGSGQSAINIDVCPPAPSSGNWIISITCILSGNEVAPGNVIISSNAVVTIPNGVTLTVPFKSYHLTVSSGSKMMINLGGKISS